MQLQLKLLCQHHRSSININGIVIMMQPSCPMAGRSPQHEVSKPVCLGLSFDCPLNSSTSSLRRLANVPVVRSSSYAIQVVIGDVHWLYRITLACLAEVHVRLLTCSIMSRTFVFSLTKSLFFSRYGTENLMCPFLSTALTCYANNMVY